MLSGFHSRGHLPHLKFAGATYFVTFRLADSLPRVAMDALIERREELRRHTSDEASESCSDTRRNSFRQYAGEVERVLDRAHGEAWLRRPEIASMTSESMRHFDGERYHLYAWVVMPNHVHAVVHPVGVYGLETILHGWKSYIAHAANRILDRTGRPFWQKESYDHWIRDGTELRHCCHYVEENPVKAGLCARSKDWPWSSACTGSGYLATGRT